MPSCYRFKRNKHGVPASVKTIEYDPESLVADRASALPRGEALYHCPLGLQRGDVLSSGPEAEVRVGNALPLGVIPTGTTVHNIEIHLGKGGQLVRGAGTGAQVMAHEDKYTLLRLPSGELRRVLSACYATIGQVGNPDHKNLSWGKAGRKRLKGWRPTVRGSAMSPRDHPHGGGEGARQSGCRAEITVGKRHSATDAQEQENGRVHRPSARRTQRLAPLEI